MSISLSNDTKNTLALVNDPKGPNPTWDESTGTWDAAQGTWSVPGLNMINDTKNTITLSNDAKN